MGEQKKRSLRIPGSTSILASLISIGVGLIGAGALNALGRNPEKLSDIRTLMITAIVFADSLAIIGIIVAYMAKG